MATFTGGPCCSVIQMNGVAGQSPEATIRQLIKSYPLKVQHYDMGEKKYIEKECVSAIHVIFGGPDMATLKPGMPWYSALGSCGTFAAFIRANSLGTVIETPGAHNPLHNERAEGIGDVIVYVWTPDAKALKTWVTENTPVEKPK